jgi:hypothetical protein
MSVAPEMVSLSSQGLQVFKEDRYSRNILFILSKREYECSSFISEFLSPKVRDLRRVDSTVNQIQVHAEDPRGCFGSFLGLGYGSSHPVNEQNQIYFRSLAEELEKAELASAIRSRFPEKLSIEAVLRAPKRKAIQGESCAEEVEFTAKHFEDGNLCGAVFKSLKVDQICQIVSNAKFLASREDWLFTKSSQLWQSDERYLCLSECVHFEYLSTDRFQEFVPRILPELNQPTWDRISLRLNASASHIRFSVEAPDHPVVTLTMSPHHTVLDLKHALAPRTGVRPPSQQLTMLRTELHNDCLLSD